MEIKQPNVSRTRVVLCPDQKRVLLRPFIPGDVKKGTRIIERILALPEERVHLLLEHTSVEFSQRHDAIRNRFLERYGQVKYMMPAAHEITEERRLLIGSYFLAEYSLESAALFNPSIVPHPDQTGLHPGALRFVLSLRATGEGHISSITFRLGVIHADQRIEVFPPTGVLTEPKPILSPREPEGEPEIPPTSNYEVQFQPEQHLSERVLFPATLSQRNGIEDARFVCFREGESPCTYYATFTAYDGRAIMPEMLETADFLRFRFIMLEGTAIRNKGMALFPRKINGRFAMLSRQDNENISIMYSDSVHLWNESQILMEPEFPWELVQIGNCGSPIETEAGWLVLSHGVGPMRRYCIGAFLLDRDDPSKVIGRLREPLIEPNQSEREGYVPNVVYSCGSLVHDGILIIPYGLADHATGFATVPLNDVLAAMVPKG